MKGGSHVAHLVHMAIATLGIHVAFNSLQNLATSILPGNIGFIVMGTQAFVFCLSALLIAPTLVSLLGPKWSLFGASLCYVVLMAGTLHPDAYVVVPAAAIMGAGAGVLWTAQGVYLTYSASHFALRNNQTRESAMGYFNGLFFAIFQGNMVIGSLIASGLMSFFRDASGDVPPSVISMLLYVYITIAGVSALCFAFLGRETAPQSDPLAAELVKKPSVGELMASFFVNLKDPRMLLLIACIIYSGAEQAFIFVNFTKDIIGQIMGTQAIGWVMAVFGAVNVLSSLALGKITDRYGPAPAVFIGWSFHAIFLIAYYVLYGLHFVPLSWFADNKWFIYFSVAFYSIGDAAWQFFPPTMIGTLFANNAEAAFANFKFFQSLGNTVFSIGGAYVAFQVKCLSSFGLLVVALICILIMNKYFSRFLRIISPDDNLAERTRLLTDSGRSVGTDALIIDVDRSEHSSLYF